MKHIGKDLHPFFIKEYQDKIYKYGGVLGQTWGQTVR